MQARPIQNTAILIFANSAAEDSRIKHFDAKSPLFHKLTQETLKTVKATGMPYHHFTEREQLGKTFAERFSNALQQVFDLGYDQVISIGNDSPHLTAQHLRNTKSALSEQQVVLGPSMDGGFYLLGLHRSNFHKESFEALPWQQAPLYKTTVAYFQSKGCTVHALKKLIDIDSIADIKLLSNHIKTLSKNWIVLFSSLFLRVKKFGAVRWTRPKQVHQPIPFNKGSPLLLV